MGSILKGIKKHLTPIIKSPRVQNLAKNIAKRAVKSSVTLGSNVIKDVMNGGDILDSLKKNVPEEGSALIQHALDEVKRGGVSRSSPRKRKAGKSSSRGKKKAKRKNSARRKSVKGDIFE